MKFQLQKYALSAFGLTLFSTLTQAQNLEPVQTIEFEAPDSELIWNRIDKESQYEGKDMVGVVLEQEFDFFEFAHHEVLLNGDSQWTLNLNSESADGLCVYFNEFHIPVGGELYLESSRRTK